MAQINVQIAGRVYRMACGDGEEDHLRALAARLDGKVTELRGSFGEIGDSRITVMAALTIADQLSDMERRLAQAEAEVQDLRRVRDGADAEVRKLADALAGALGEAAARIDRVARSLVAPARD